jgi:hypothetical protein
MFHGKDMLSSPWSSIGPWGDCATEVVASETLDGRLGNGGILVGILAIAFLHVDIPRAGEAPFCFEEEAEDGS